MEAIKLRDIEDLKPKLCAKKMNLKIDEFENILNNARYKIAKEIYYNNCIKIVIEEEIKEEDALYLHLDVLFAELYTKSMGMKIK
ncbi:DUF134 domain-containing protein [Paraclostridium bifermentans]|nr:DUF134 domain-containing protein [Paraclostridium bifermentans]